MSFAASVFPTELSLSSLSGSAVLIRASRETAFFADRFGPYAMPDLTHFLALGMASPFMAMPTMGTTWTQVPATTQFLLWKERSGSYHAMVSLMDRDFCTSASGVDNGLVFTVDGGVSATRVQDVALALIASSEDPYLATQEALAEAVRWMDRGKLREDKRVPQWINYLGWCTWDAFYTDVDEEKILDGLRAFHRMGVHPRHLIIDEGWQDATPQRYLKSLGFKAGAFTDGSLKELIRRAKSEFGVEMVGCWRTLFGHLRGVDVQSEGLSEFRRRLVREVSSETDTFGVVEPEDVGRFHDAYAARLAGEGVDFMKVDFQSALHLMTYEQMGRAEAARLWQHALQDSINKHFHGELLNCMSMGMDEVYHTRTSNVCRTSDDFFPSKEESHPAHIRQNIYNSLWMQNLQWPDWDMFHSKHPWAEYHAIGRAISGGPVYVSDKPGESDAELLNKFPAADGKLLRCPQPALPVRRLLFRDPVAELRPMMAFNRCGEVGLVAVFHSSSNPHAAAMEFGVGPRDFEASGEVTYAVFEVTSGFQGLVESDGQLFQQVSFRQAKLFIFSPVIEGFAPIGLLDKWNPPASIQTCLQEERTQCLKIRGGGRFGFYSKQAPSHVELNGKPAEVCDEGGGLFSCDTGENALCTLRIEV